MTLPLPEYDRMDALAMAEAVHRGELSPRDLLEAAIARIEVRNDALNAVVERLFDRARSRVDALPDGPLKGVPFLLKDLKLQLAGTVTTNSTKLLANVVAERSSVLAERYEAAGLQILGKTNTPEFGITGTTEPELRGPARNPWNPEHTPGGSSGGSGSAVAARMVPAAHAGDGGGSIRIPASACGLVGLKPTRGRVTMAPFTGEAWCGFVQEHVLSHSVRDCAAFLDAVDQPTPGEPYAAPAKERPWSEEVLREPGKLRVAFMRDALFADTQHADCTAAVDDAANLLRSLGHDVVEARVPFPREKLVRAYLLAVAAGTARMVEDTAARAGVSPRAADFEPGTWMLALIGWKMSAADLINANTEIQRAAREVAAFFEDYDVLLTSTLARPPVRVGELGVTKAERLQVSVLRHLAFKPVLDFALEKMASGRLAATPNTQLFNQTGQPAISLPLSWNAAGLPIGVQFASKFGGEATLLRLARQLEVARPWADRLPPVVAADQRVERKATGS